MQPNLHRGEEKLDGPALRCFGREPFETSARGRRPATAQLEFIDGFLFVSQSFPLKGRPDKNIGGMQRVAVELHDALQMRDDLRLDNIILESSSRWHLTVCVPWMFKTLYSIIKKASREQIKAVFFASMPPASLMILVQKILAEKQIPAAAIAHGRDIILPGLYQSLIIKRVLGALDAVLPVSRATAAECLARGMPAEKTHIVPNGVNKNQFTPSTDFQRTRCEMGRIFSGAQNVLPEDAILLCSVGRQVKRKGYVWFIRNVMPHLPENVHYWLAGAGPRTPRIKRAIIECGLGNRVRVLGRVAEADLPVLYRGSDLFIMPDVSVPGEIEGFGVVMLEAGASGTPTIAARLEGIQDVIKNDVNGLLLESRNARAFRDAILGFAHDRSALQRFSGSAYRHTVANYSWEAIGNRHIEILRGLIVSKQIAHSFLHEYNTSPPGLVTPDYIRQSGNK